jgi:hypothetical protein
MSEEDTGFDWEDGDDAEADGDDYDDWEYY